MTVPLPPSTLSDKACKKPATSMHLTCRDLSCVLYGPKSVWSAVVCIPPCPSWTGTALRGCVVSLRQAQRKKLCDGDERMTRSPGIESPPPHCRVSDYHPLLLSICRLLGRGTGTWRQYPSSPVPPSPEGVDGQGE